MTTNNSDTTPTRRDRALTALAWYSPELIAAGVTAGAAATVWAPLGLISAALAARIVADSVSIARSNRKVAAQRATTPTDGNAENAEKDQHEEEVA